MKSTDMEKMSEAAFSNVSGQSFKNDKAILRVECKAMHEKLKETKLIIDNMPKSLAHIVKRFTKSSYFCKSIFSTVSTNNITERTFMLNITPSDVYLDFLTAIKTRDGVVIEHFFKNFIHDSSNG